MDSQINLPAIFIANIMGIIIFICASISSFSSFKLSAKHRKPMLTMFIASCISCIADPICFLVDGKPGLINYVLVFWCNTWLYVGNVIVAISWIILISRHVNIKLSKIHKTVFCVLGAGVVVMLIVNIFIPIVFSVNENNVYSRSDMNWTFYVLNMFLLADGIILYYLGKLKSGKIKFFPIWAFIFPVLIGMAIQLKVYGVSTVTPFTMIALGCLTSSLQNEILFTDKLTGLYNRYYIDIIKTRILKNKSACSIMLLDINHFKSINDIYGHIVGDKALIEVSNVLKSVVENGEVLRYAGDEFIVVINTQKDAQVQETVSRIQQALSDFNKSSGNPYELSVSLGYGKLDLIEKSLDEVLDIIDKRMYDNKQKQFKDEEKRIKS